MAYDNSLPRWQRGHQIGHRQLTQLSDAIAAQRPAPAGPVVNDDYANMHRTMVARIYNSSEEDTIPAYAAMAATWDDEKRYYEVTKPGSDSIKNVMILDDAPLPPQSWRLLRSPWVRPALIEDALEPAAGVSLGTVEDQWYLDDGRTGFVCYGWHAEYGQEEARVAMAAPFNGGVVEIGVDSGTLYYNSNHHSHANKTTHSLWYDLDTPFAMSGSTVICSGNFGDGRIEAMCNPAQDAFVNFGVEFGDADEVIVATIWFGWLKIPAQANLSYGYSASSMGEETVFASPPLSVVGAGTQIEKIRWRCKYHLGSGTYFSVDANGSTQGNPLRLYIF